MRTEGQRAYREEPKERYSRGECVCMCVCVCVCGRAGVQRRGKKAMIGAVSKRTRTRRNWVLSGGDSEHGMLQFL